MAEPDLPTLKLTRTVIVGLIVVTLFFGGLATWSIAVPLETGAVATGTVVVEGRRQTVQHLEGGIAGEILVEEGSKVEAGQVLIRLDDVRAQSERDTFRNRLARALAREARLIAERDQAENVTFPEAIQSLIQTAAEREEVHAGEARIHAARVLFLQQQEKLAEQQIAQINEEIKGLRQEINAQDRQLSLIAEELQDLKTLLDKGHATNTRYLELSRESAEIDGARARNVSAIARAEQQIQEAKLSILETQTQFLNEVVIELRDVRQEIADLKDSLRAAEDVIDRLDVIAPVAGFVVDLALVTPGGIIAPGEPILDIVPSDDSFVVEAKVQPTDIDIVRPGLSAEVQLTVFKQDEVAPIFGTVLSVAADATSDERSGETYYVTRVSLPDPAAGEIGVDLYQGMPADILIVTGERTVLSYLVDPLVRTMEKSMRSE